MAQTDAEFIAIFDSDFVPPRDFLRRCIGPLLADPTLALVQARWDHLNANDGLLTRAQALRLKDLAEEAYQPQQFAANLSFDEAARRIDVSRRRSRWRIRSRGCSRRPWPGPPPAASST